MTIEPPNSNQSNVRLPGGSEVARVFVRGEMHLYDFVTKEQLSDLPDDGKLAFAELVRIADQILLDRTRALDFQEGWQELNDWRYSFLNVVIGAAKIYEISSIAAIHLEPTDNFDDKSYRSARAELDHYTTQIALESAIKDRRSVVNLSEAARDRISTYLHHLKDEVEKSSLPDAKKSTLMDALDKFEQELKKRRVGIASVALVALTVLGAPGSLWSSYKLVSELVSNVLQVVGEAKEAEDALRLPVVEKPAALPPPRPKPKPMLSALDDDIPF